MAISKRLRFEILRRDNFRCTYCGATPAEEEMHIDHVIPRALGGQDTPENLTTSCEPCNSGKTSIAPTEEMVAAVDEAIAIEQAARARLTDAVIEYAEGLDSFEDEVQSLWEFHVPQYKRARTPRWDLSRIAEWHRDGVPVSLLEFGLRIAVQANVPPSGLSAYAAAVVRNKIEEVGRGQNQDDQT